MTVFNWQSLSQGESEIPVPVGAPSQHPGPYSVWIHNGLYLKGLSRDPGTRGVPSLYSRWMSKTRCTFMVLFMIPGAVELTPNGKVV